MATTRPPSSSPRPGDVLLMHPLTMHTRPTNAGRLPRFLLNKDLYPPRGPSAAVMDTARRDTQPFA